MLPEEIISRKYYGVLHHNPSPHSEIVTMTFHPYLVK